MKPWNTEEDGRDARSDATIAFCMFLKDLPPAERSRYTLPKPTPVEEAEASAAARELFAKVGEIYLEEDPARPEDIPGIPKNLPFRIYELDPFDDRDDVVTFVLPQPGAGPRELPQFYYRCSYWPY